MSDGPDQPGIAGIPPALLSGYQRFRAELFPRQEALYRRLESQQRPRQMVIACADSRVDPATIFAVAPGELFVVRNVANLIPAAEARASRELAAALAFAVNQLEVSDIVVLGHGGCGGIAACLGLDYSRDHSHDPVADWVREALPARAEVERDLPAGSSVELQRALEHAAIYRSLTNLAGYQPVVSAVGNRRLRLHGAWFSIGEGRLEWIDPRTREFITVPAAPGDGPLP
ncbi:MAG: carbonic anhydrase [Alphaproteobacteria bacterium]